MHLLGVQRKGFNRMTLKEYLADIGMNQKTFAERHGIEYQRFSALVAGRAEPSLQEVSDIYGFTKKKVTYWDWLNK